MSSVPKLPAALPARRSAPATSSRALTAPEFHELAQVPPAAEWFANIDNPNTRRAYRNDLKEFMRALSNPRERTSLNQIHERLLDVYGERSVFPLLRALPSAFA